MVRHVPSMQHLFYSIEKKEHNRKNSRTDIYRILNFINVFLTSSSVSLIRQPRMKRWGAEYK